MKNDLPQAPYSRDIALCDFFLFLLQLPPTGHRLDVNRSNISEVAGRFHGYNDNEYNNHFEDWKKRCNECIRMGGD